MCDQLLRDTDVMSMAHGLEVRCPLIDHELVEFMVALPPELRFGRRPKALLLRALSAEITPAIVQWPKTGSALPFEQWLRDDLSDSIRELLDSPSDLIDRGFALRLYADFHRGRLHWSRIWAIVVLHLWLRQFRQAASDAPWTNRNYSAAPSPVVEPPPASA